MKILPVIFDQNLQIVNKKINYYNHKTQSVLQTTNQENLSLSIYFVYPNFSKEYNIANTISPINLLSEAFWLFPKKMNLYINYLSTAEDLKDTIPVGYKYDFLPLRWTFFLYIPFENLSQFQGTLGKIFRIGALFFLTELSQEKINQIKDSGCKNFSLLGRHILHQGEINDEEISKIIDIVTFNQDCQFIVNTESKSLIEGLKKLNNIQICLDKSYWQEKIDL